MSHLNFNEMLDNLYKQIDRTTDSTVYLPEPKINKKPTRIDWTNTDKFLKTVNRSFEHFINYLKVERKICAGYQNKIFIIPGRFRKEDINKIMLEYVNKFCKCPVCNSFDTILAKDGTVRKEKIICNKCKSITFCS